jgi:hypothetical protein
MPKHRRDESGELFGFAKQIVKKKPEFKLLKSIRILFTWRDTPRKDDEGAPVAARASKLGPQLRDLMGKDAMIEVYEGVWSRLDKPWKRRLIEHELRHIRVVTKEEDGQEIIDRDKEGRVKVEIVPHDVVIKTFKDEIEEWGISITDLITVKYLADVYRRQKKGDLGTYETPEALMADPEK